MVRSFSLIPKFDDAAWHVHLYIIQLRIRSTSAQDRTAYVHACMQLFAAFMQPLCEPSSVAFSVDGRLWLASFMSSKQKDDRLEINFQIDRSIDRASRLKHARTHAAIPPLTVIRF